MVRLRYLKILLGGWILFLLLVSGLAAPVLAPFDPQEQRLESRLQPPTWMGGKSSSRWLGPDNLGRAILSRIIYGSRISLLVGATTVILAGLVGCFLGAISGYFGHGTDEVVSKITEIFLAFPFLLLAIDDEPLGTILPRRPGRGAVLKGTRFCHRGQGAGG